MYPIDLVKYTNTKKKIPKKILASAAEIYPTTRFGLFTGFMSDGFYLFAGLNALGQILTMQISSYLVGNMKMKAVLSIDIFGLTAAAYAPLIGCMYFALTHYLNDGQSYGLHRSKMKFHVNDGGIKHVLRVSVFSSAIASVFGLPLLSKTFVKWSEKFLNFKFLPSDHLYHELFVPKNEWAPSLVEMTQSHDTVVETNEDDYSYSNVA